MGFLKFFLGLDPEGESKVDRSGYSGRPIHKLGRNAVMLHEGKSLPLVFAVKITRSLTVNRAIRLCSFPVVSEIGNKMAQVCNCSFSFPDTRRLDHEDQITSSLSEPIKESTATYSPSLVERRQMWGALRSAADPKPLSTASSTGQDRCKGTRLARKFAIYLHSDRTRGVSKGIKAAVSVSEH